VTLQRKGPAKGWGGGRKGDPLCEKEGGAWGKKVQARRCKKTKKKKRKGKELGEKNDCEKKRGRGDLEHEKKSRRRTS